VPFPYVEVHISNIEKRGIHSLLAETAVGMITGFGMKSYFLGLDALLDHLAKGRAPRRSARAKRAPRRAAR
jgi:3-dehydroquinate dehydratase-2